MSASFFIVCPFFIAYPILSSVKLLTALQRKGFKRKKKLIFKFASVSEIKEICIYVSISFINV